MYDGIDVVHSKDSRQIVLENLKKRKKIKQTVGHFVHFLAQI